VWEEGARVFWAFEQTTVTSKCEAGLSYYGGQQTISPTEQTSPVALVKFLPIIFVECCIRFAVQETATVKPWCTSSFWVHVNSEKYINFVYINMLREAHSA
jgi:hypothetical protein